MRPRKSAESVAISIGIVVVNWKNAPDTLHCLESLRVAQPLPCRVVVVDNGSRDNSTDQFRNWALENGLGFESVHFDRRRGDGQTKTRSSPSREPWLTILDVGVNLGFAGGSNGGLALLKSDKSLTHFLLLNNDALVAPNYFAEISAALASNPDAGLCIGTIFELPDRARVWYAGGRIIPLRALVTHNLNLPPGEEPIETEFVTGCAMVISRAALDRVGMLPECYFPGYMEDAEYSWRVRASGYDLIYAPRATVYHKVGATFGPRAMSTVTAYHLNRHRLFFVRRNLRGTRRLAAMMYMALTKPGRALIDVLQGRPDIGWATLRGTLAGLLSRATRNGDRALDRRAFPLIEHEAPRQ